MNRGTLTPLGNDDFFKSISLGLSQDAFDIIVDGPVGIWVSQASPTRLFVNENAKRLLQLDSNDGVFTEHSPPCLSHLLKHPDKKGLQTCQGSDVFSFLISQRASTYTGLFLRCPESDLPLAQPDEQELLKLVMQLPHLAVQGYDHHGKLIYWNEASSELYGYSLDQAVGKNMEELLIPQSHQGNFPTIYKRWLANPGVAPNRNCIRMNCQGQKIQVQTTQIVLQNGSREAELYCLDYSDDGTRRQQQQLHKLEYYDQLTQLPNRQLMHSLLEQSLKVGQQLDLCTAVMFIGIDKFTLVNSEFGHEVGDHILKKVADRILTIASFQDLKSRFGGDVYALSFNVPKDNKQVSRIARRLLAALSKELHLEKGPERISASIGIALSPFDGEDASTLLQHGDAALAQAKADGGGCFVYFDPELNRSNHRVHFIANDLERALDAGELHLSFQPQFQLDSEMLCGSESLIRWQHEQLGDISPAEFIPILERQKGMLVLDFWVTKQLLKTIQEYLEQGIEPPRIFVNLSAATINHKDFRHNVSRVLEKYNVPSHAVGIELTEHTLIHNEPQAVANLHWCQEKGIKIALDDFGTGFSSLSYLAKLPIDIIKIDRLFISAIDKKHNRELVKTIIAIAHSLSMEVLCEGVQTREQEDFLREHGCEMVQGHYYTEALDSEQWLALIQSKGPNRHCV
ncbi:sensor domain-containing phosphodiesterase [Pseudoteredinibacter isoporae]|uniref:Diguanylate cyclase (GGDEF)-like protein/PAS domain S-box-containing protein n=1 Tax=Pseudoteredinibacter isoporae TaxID=570281 RepID=A0A7X0MTQ4_9GAMM|nr:sensor domain-containing phosphodiesterase [Pseudoteredinibacter isoporae]MBB6519781.1 diguanylate cyclase (GGDEF)-like protein/PAS domain S-box-containing protein [Pseudoteredinibacter isoporae]NHO85362.1 sensor domain-containing phosphodiesterase [Pseudoteredinibacter isoporae]NIB26186.1 sensor domain-containing phosphodiesterase [Pseudoteredinibacter isoporae]